ncbi:MAG: RNA polymerase sigma factor [Ginsengibacter sp.]
MTLVFTGAFRTFCKIFSFHLLNKNKPNERRVRGIKDYPVTRETNLLSAGELRMHIEKCTFTDRHSQKKIYNSFYCYAMTVCGQYAENEEDTVEILNDGFLKIFKEIYHFKPAFADVARSFKGWLRKIMVHTAIEHFRKNQKHRFINDTDNKIPYVSSGGENAISIISYREIIRSICALTPVYRTVLNLFVIKEFSHEEISYSKRHKGIHKGKSRTANKP